MGCGQSGEVGGRSQIPLPGFIRNSIIQAVNDTEKLLGRPGTYVECYTVFDHNYGSYGGRLIRYGYVNAFFQNMYREDIFYCDEGFIYWSTSLEGENKKGYENFSQRFRRKFPTYVLDSTMHIRAGPETNVVNLKELMALFKSTDEALWEKNKWIFDNDRKFLDGAINKSNKVGFQSFPRSGNTFLRKYFELLTGIETGADNTLNVNIHLQMQGLKGEDTVDDTVWVVKTHSPWCMPQAPVFHCNRIICIVRSPIDVIISFLQLFTLCNHSQKAPFEYHEKYPVFWDWWVKLCCQRMANWYRTLMNDAKMKNLPVLFVRFEDLVVDPEPQLANIMRMLNNMTDITGTNAERRVKEVIAKGKEATVVYQLKDTTRNLATNHKRYNKEQLAFIEHEMKDIMYYFGYAKVDSDPDSYTAFHEYKEHDPELLKTYNGYKLLNQHSIEWNAYMSDEERAQIWFMNSNPDKSTEVIDWDEGDIISKPVLHDCE